MTFSEPFKNFPDDNKSQLQKFGEELKKSQSTNHGGNTHGACPRCGYCSSCGRGGAVQTIPGPYVPHPLETPFWAIQPQLGSGKAPEY